jgi:hypothetical protein
MTLFVLNGRWSGTPNTPDHHFSGIVVTPADSGLAMGAPVQVIFETGQPAVYVSSAQVHGQYSLGGMPSHAFVLASFVRQDGPPTAQTAHDDVDGLWGGELFQT